MTEHEREFTDGVRRALDRAADALDPHVLERLRAARRQALAAARTSARRAPAWRSAAGLAVAGVAALLVGGLLWWSAPRPPRPATLAGLEDLELLALREGPEFYADLDFYDWLARGDDEG
jgi:hypothetical protein